MGMNCGLAAWTTRLFSLAVATHAFCIVLNILDGWDSHFVGPDGDDGGAGVADSAALLAAKRQGAHGGCMIQQIFVLGMCAMAAVVNEM
jgi:hypothetical protein